MRTTPLQLRLRTALTQALSSRDALAAAPLRSALSAIANAEAVPPAETSSRQTSSEHVAGAAAGLGATEAVRRELTEADIAAIVTTEITDRQSAAAEYERLGRADQSERLRREAEILAKLLTVR
jgi:uncharacterized protein YqeY